MCCAPKLKMRRGKVVSRRRCDLQDRGDGGFLSAVERRDSTVFCFSFTSVPLFFWKKKYFAGESNDSEL